MRLVHKDGTYQFEDDGADPTVEAALGEYPAYMEALPRYLAALGQAFDRAYERCEFEFLLSLSRIRSMQDPGWDPYETTLQGIPALKNASDAVESYEASRHLALFMYCHIYEASEPYELLSNLIDVATGGRFKTQRFPRSIMPTRKIERLAKQAADAGMPSVAVPFVEVWDRHLRNAVFHADYALYGNEVRIMNPRKSYSKNEVSTLINRALAYHEALSHLYRNSIKSYTEPKRIPVHPSFSRVRGREEYAMVVVREGYGAVGMKHAWKRQELSEEEDRIHWFVGQVSQQESQLLNDDLDLALLPAAPKEPGA